jgi:hypothetical protein
MKTTLLVIVHIVALALAYLALGVVINHWFEIELPLPEGLSKNKLLPFGVYYLLPVCAFFAIKFYWNILSKMLGYFYLVCWVLALIRFISILLQK